MSALLRIILIIASVLYLIFVLIRVRRSKIQIIDSIFWILLSLFFIFISCFPELASWGAKITGIQTTSNFIYLLVIFLLMLKTFLQSMKLSQLEIKLKTISQKIALEEYENKDNGTVNSMPDKKAK